MVGVAFSAITHSNSRPDSVPFHVGGASYSRSRLEKMSGGERQLAVGLISGTSMDGIDACVLEVTEERQSDSESTSATASHHQLK